LIDDLAAFVRLMPAWVGGDGLPLSWRHYVYAMGHINRAHKQHLLDSAAFTRAAGFAKNDYVDWRNKVEEG